MGIVLQLLRNLILTIVVELLAAAVIYPPLLKGRNRAKIIAVNVITNPIANILAMTGVKALMLFNKSGRVFLPAVYFALQFVIEAAVFFAESVLIRKWFDNITDKNSTPYLISAGLNIPSYLAGIILGLLR